MLYQQGTQRIEIIIRKDSGSSLAGANETNTDEISGKQSTWNTSGKTKQQLRTERIIKTNVTHALAMTKQVVDLWGEYFLAEKEYKNGDQALQDRISRQIEIIKDVTNVASSVAMGALYGSWGGPVGALLGMGFAAASTGTSIAVKYLGREREFNYKMFKENNSLEYQRARANINLTTGRLR